jgi:hypothetical protein
MRDLNPKMDGDLAQFIWDLERHIKVADEDMSPRRAFALVHRKDFPLTKRIFISGFLFHAA